MKEILTCVMFIALLATGFEHFEIKRYEAEEHAKRAYFELEVRYKEAEAKIAEQRTLELKYACQLINKHGETYTSKDC